MSYLILPPLDPDKKLEDWIRIHMDIFGILDPHENLCGSETLQGAFKMFTLLRIQTVFGRLRDFKIPESNLTLEDQLQL